MSHRRITGLVALLALASLALAPGVASAASYTYTTLSVAGQRITSASGMQNALNNQDQVVGGVEDSAFNFQGFVWQNGHFKLYPVTDFWGVIDNRGLAAGYVQGPGRGYVTIDTRTGKTRSYDNGFDRNPFMAHLYGINTSGAVVAQDEYAPTITAGYVFAGRTKTLVLVPGSDVKYGGTYATAINDCNIVAGYYYSGGTHEHGFLYQGGSYTSFDVPGALGGTFPHVITNTGAIGGGYATAPSSAQIGFVLDGGKLTTINPPGALTSYVNGISGNGIVAGSFWDSANMAHGFVYRAGAYHQIDYPGGTHTNVNAVNARGSLVGSYLDGNGNTQSFIARCPSGEICTR